MSFIVTQSFTFLRDIISLCRSKFPHSITFLRKCSAATGERNKTHPWSPAIYSLLKAMADKEEKPWALPVLSHCMTAMWCWRYERRKPSLAVLEYRNWTWRTTRENHGMPDQNCTWDDSRTPLQDLEPADISKEGYPQNTLAYITPSLD